MKPIHMALFLSVFYAVGIGLLVYALIALRRSSTAAGWPTTAGTIVRCELASNSDGDGDPTYQAKVDYDYTVGTRRYSGNRIAFGYSFSSGWEAHNQIYQALHSAKTIRVRYDPADPANSTLSFGLHKSIRFMMAFAITWLAFVIGFSVIMWVGQQPDNVLLQNLVLK